MLGVMQRLLLLLLLLLPPPLPLPLHPPLLPLRRRRRRAVQWWPQRPAMACASITVGSAVHTIEEWWPVCRWPKSLVFCSLAFCALFPFAGAEELC